MFTVGTLTWLGLEWARLGLDLVLNSMDTGEGEADAESEPVDEKTDS